MRLPAILLLLAGCAGGPEPTAERRPNVVFILTDNQANRAYLLIGCLMRR